LGNWQQFLSIEFRHSMGFSALLILGTHRTICVHDYARNPHLSDIVAKPEFFSCHAMRALNREDHLSNNRSSNNILNRDSQWSLAIDSDVLLVFRDDGSDYGPRRGAKFHRTAYRAIQHDAEVVAETVTDTMRGKKEPARPARSMTRYTTRSRCPVVIFSSPPLRTR